MNALEARSMANNNIMKRTEKYEEAITTRLSGIILQRVENGCHNATYRFSQCLFDYESNVSVFNILNKFRADGYHISVARSETKHNDGFNFAHWSIYISW